MMAMKSRHAAALALVGWYSGLPIRKQARRLPLLYSNMAGATRRTTRTKTIAATTFYMPPV